ncbi:MAG: hypothetical protein R2877_04405 [Bdellovibrionota bacterium]
MIPHPEDVQKLSKPFPSFTISMDRFPVSDQFCAEKIEDVYQDLNSRGVIEKSTVFLKPQLKSRFTNIEYWKCLTVLKPCAHFEIYGPSAVKKSPLNSFWNGPMNFGKSRLLMQRNFKIECELKKNQPVT